MKRAPIVTDLQGKATDPVLDAAIWQAIEWMQNRVGFELTRAERMAFYSGFVSGMSYARALDAAEAEQASMTRQ